MDGFLLVVCSIAVWILYHKIFTVAYFDFGRGCLMEILGCVCAGFALMLLIRKFWYIAIIIAVLAVVGIAGKNKGN